MMQAKRRIYCFYCLIVALLITMMGTMYGANAATIVPTQYKIADYAGEESFSVFSDFEGSLYTVGSNGSAQLGRGYKSATKIIEPKNSNPLDGVASFTTGRGGFVLAIKQNGEVYAWGQNRFAQLAQGADVFIDETDENNAVVRPQLVNFADGSKITAVAAGLRHSLFLNTNGEVFAAGSNSAGQLGLGIESGRRVVKGTATKIDQAQFDNDKIIMIGAAEDTSYALSEAGNVYAWGDNFYGQIGNGNSDRNHLYLTPQKLPLTDIVKISAGASVCMAIDSDGVVFVWGNNGFGQLGIPSFAEGYSPNALELTSVYTQAGTEIENVEFIDILCGGMSNFVLSSTGDVYGFGAGGSGQLGFEIELLANTNPFVNVNRATAPIKISFFTPLSIYDITQGDDDSLKNHLPVDRTTPIEVNIDRLVNSAGTRTFVMDEDGNMWSWGNNADGLAASGDLNTCFVPVRSTLFRNDNYDKEIITKNYLLRPAIGLGIILGLTLVFFAYSEIKIRVARRGIKVKAN